MNTYTDICETHGRIRCGECRELEGLRADIAELKEALESAISLTRVSEAAQDDEWDVERERVIAVAAKHTESKPVK